MTQTRSGWKVGELSRATGLTVRTLHHYDEIGLVRPSGRTAAGHRMYGEDDVQELYRVVALRRLGLGLERIRDCLAADVDLRRLVADQVDHTGRQLAALRRVHERLRSAAALLDRDGGGAASDLVTLMEEVRMAEDMIETYYTPEQLEQLSRRREELGDDRIREVEQAWPRLTAEVEAAMAAGIDPADPRARAFADRWDELVRAFTGGDPGIAASLQRLRTEKGAELRVAHGGPSPEVGAYVQRAREARDA